MSEKKYETTITDMPSPPRSQPTSARAKSTSAFDMPQRSITVPAKTKLGIASCTQCCDAPTRLDASISSELPPSTSPMTAAAPSAKTIGTEKATRTTKRMPVVASSMSVVSRRGDPGLVEALGRQHRLRLDGRRETVKDDQRAADRRRGVEPSEVDLQGRRG